MTSSSSTATDDARVSIRASKASAQRTRRTPATGRVKATKPALAPTTTPAPTQVPVPEPSQVPEIEQAPVRPLLPSERTGRLYRLLLIGALLVGLLAAATQLLGTDAADGTVSGTGVGDPPPSMLYQPDSE